MGSQALYKDIVARVRSGSRNGVADWVVESDAQRMLVATEGDDELAVKKLKDAALWRVNTLTGWISDEAKRAPLECRVIALGEKKRPMLYCCAVHQRSGDTPRQWACAWEQALQSAAAMSQFDFIIDGHGFQPMLNLNPAPFLQVAGALDSYFAERVHQIFVVDFPSAARFIWNAIQPLLPPKTRQKVNFVARGSPEEMNKLYDLCCQEGMQEMLQALLKLNKSATNKTEKNVSHNHTNEFVEKQKRELGGSS